MPLPAAAAGALPATPPARESSMRRGSGGAAPPGLTRSVSFSADVADDGPTSPRAAEEMRKRAEALRIQAALLEREATEHDHRQRIAFGTACSGSSAALQDAWGEMMKVRVKKS